MKLCKKCNSEKPLSSFHKCKKSKDKLSHQCSDCAKAYMAEYAIKNRQRILEIKRNAYNKNKASWDNYRLENAESIAARKRAWYAEKVKSDPSYKIKERLRKMVYRTLEASGEVKRKRTAEALGYTSEDLRLHLERQFLKGMNWGNYGDWHIDHVLPISVMVNSGITDPKKVNCLSNLRPLWASDNISKGAKVERLI